MSNYTTSQIENALRLASNNNLRYFWWRKVHDGETLTLIDEDVPFKIEESFGGEGSGDEAWYVLFVGDQYFKIDGYWTSWDGADFADATVSQVYPKEVMVRQWSNYS